jgi:uncharacterized membrane protein
MKPKNRVILSWLVSAFQWILFGVTFYLDEHVAFQTATAGLATVGTFFSILSTFTLFKRCN